MAASASHPVASGSSSVKLLTYTVIGKLNRYLAEAADRNATPDALILGQNRPDAFSKLAALAEDVIAAPASQAFIERIFSSCGMLTTCDHRPQKPPETVTGNAGISKTQCKHCLIWTVLHVSRLN